MNVNECSVFRRHIWDFMSVDFGAATSLQKLPLTTSREQKQFITMAPINTRWVKRGKELQRWFMSKTPDRADPGVSKLTAGRYSCNARSVLYVFV